MTSEQTLRQEQLNEWYEKDGRHDKSHPMHSLFTGLAKKYMNKNKEEAVYEIKDIWQLFGEHWAESYPAMPADKQSAESHVAFAMYVLAKINIISVANSQTVSQDVFND